MYKRTMGIHEDAVGCAYMKTARDCNRSCVGQEKVLCRGANLELPSMDAHLGVAQGLEDEL